MKRYAFVEIGRYESGRYEFEGQFEIVKIKGLPGLFINLEDAELPEEDPDDELNDKPAPKSAERAK